MLGQAPFLSWGLLHMGVIALAVPIVTRRWGPTVIAGAVVVASAVAWGLGGYWMWDGIAATHEAFSRGIADARPYFYFLLADVALLGALIGPAGIGGLFRWRRLDRATLWLAGLALGTAALGALGGFERGEVERIWLPIACWVVPAAAALAVRDDRSESVAEPAADPVPGPAAEPMTEPAIRSVAGSVTRPVSDPWAGRLRWWLVAQAGAALVIETVVRTSW
ncbi:hypothetical protein GCM10025865_17750 [Paraoerskovia sediminicola]|uniref:Uncharacterized protein n=1 Tax=Paraoerskovia sediminicola TaxID=1138587 RepID=A0ABM8G2W9_9CELL|nr:hypothetical protein [Paraoerskovia sediminicola]BDZ42476.1 hypothetical protein GCM10025865_17750 [Paraoerskovia sediminicola]